jgi:hypothetical protein
MCVSSVIFKQLPKANYHPLDENSPNLVTLIETLRAPKNSNPYINKGCQIYLGK